MARNWTPSLHPRDRNGKFARKGGAGRVATIRGNVARSRAQAADYRAKNPIAAAKADARASAQMQKAVAVNRVIAGAVMASSTSQAYQGARGVGRHLAANRPTMAAVSAGIATVNTASALNSAHFIRKTGTPTFKARSVQEKSKFMQGYAKRTVALGVAHNGLVSAYNAAAVDTNRRGMDPLIRKVANKQGMNRVYAHYGDKAAARGLRTGLQEARANRHGVYNISDVKGKRVA